MNKLLIPCFIMVCLFLTACDEEEANESMQWSIENQSTEDVKCDYIPDQTSKINLESNNMGGDVVLTCENYDLLNPIADNSNTYNYGWVTITIEANKIKIYFPYVTYDAPTASEQITVSARKGKQVVNTIINLKRTFGDGLPDWDPQLLPNKYKFKLKQIELRPFMDDDFILPAPLDQLILGITDINDNYSPNIFPDYTQYYDSIIWSAEGLPNTLKIYEKSNTAKSFKVNLTSWWGTHFFKSGTIKNYLKGYRKGKVEYTDELNITLYERDFLCFDWTCGSVVLKNPRNIGVFCLLDKKYEYQVAHTQEANGILYSRITPWNHKFLSKSDFLAEAQKSIKTLMKNNLGDGQKADGEESLFKCLPDNVKAELFWENKTTRMLLLHQLPSELAEEKYFLHIESKEKADK